MSKQVKNKWLQRIWTMLYNPYRELGMSWVQLKRYKHLPKDAGINSHRLWGKELYFHSVPELFHGFQEIFIDKIYQLPQLQSPFIIDCGANIGMSVIYLKHQFPDARIIAFEPDERNAELLNKNVQSFGYDQVEVRQEAVWKENTTLLFSNESSMGSKIQQEVTGLSREVAAVRLKDFLQQPVDFLKIDIEGAEFEVLKDIRDELHHVHHLFLEYHGSFEQNGELVTMLQILLDAGFQFYIKEASNVYPTPFHRTTRQMPYDVQLNIFCFRNK